MDILANAYGGITGIEAPSKLEMMDKINEIIDKVNELDIKLHTAKFFTSDQEKAIKELLELLGDEK